MEDSRMNWKEEKIAILIANDKSDEGIYKQEPLEKPQTNLKDMEQYLREIGFENIDCHSNVTLQQCQSIEKQIMNKAMDCQSEKENLVLFLFYAGHGESVQGFTNIITIDNQRFNIEKLLQYLQGQENNISIGFLDCCRVISEVQRGGQQTVPNSTSIRIYGSSQGQGVNDFRSASYFFLKFARSQPFTDFTRLIQDYQLHYEEDNFCIDNKEILIKAGRYSKKTFKMLPIKVEPPKPKKEQPKKVQPQTSMPKEVQPQNVQAQQFEAKYPVCLEYLVKNQNFINFEDKRSFKIWNYGILRLTRQILLSQNFKYINLEKITHTQLQSLQIYLLTEKFLYSNVDQFEAIRRRRIEEREFREFFAAIFFFAAFIFITAATREEAAIEEEAIRAAIFATAEEAEFARAFATIARRIFRFFAFFIATAAFFAAAFTAATRRREYKKCQEIEEPYSKIMQAIVQRNKLDQQN